MHKVLVTGATGFIGKQMVHCLLQNNMQVRALVRTLARRDQLPDQIEVIQGDITQPETIVGLCQDIDTVFHLAGFAHALEETNLDFAQQHHTINFLGTKNILNEAQESRVKNFVLLSSVKAVGESDHCINENWSALPNSSYGIAKREAEKLVLSAKNTGMHVCVLRSALVYGPEWKGNLASMLNAIKRGLFPPIPKINNRRSMISVEDICQAAILAANHPNANGKVYFVTDGNDYSTYDIYSLMRHALGKTDPNWSLPLWIFKLMTILGDIGGKITRRRLPFNSEIFSKLFGSASYSSQLICSELGFKPSYDLKKMLPKIVNKL